MTALWILAGALVSAAMLVVVAAFATGVHYGRGHRRGHR